MKKVKQLTSQVQRSKGWNRHVNPEEKKESSQTPVQTIFYQLLFREVSAWDFYLLSSPSSSFL